MPHYNYRPSRSGATRRASPANSTLQYYMKQLVQAMHRRNMSGVRSVLTRASRNSRLQPAHKKKLAEATLYLHHMNNMSRTQVRRRR